MPINLVAAGTILRRFPILILVALAIQFSPRSAGADNWMDISAPLLNRLTNSGAKPEWPGGCSGVVVNRLNGNVTIKLVGLGLWSSSDNGQSWEQVDNKTVSGRDETGWATSVDQNAPVRMASFSLDGQAGWTVDGRHWKSFTNLGRNWDFGSVDWAEPAPKTIIAAKHETTLPGEVYISEDGGVSWRKLAIRVSEQRDQISMIGALGSTVFIYSSGNGIQRSVDSGVTWTRVSASNPQTRIPILFGGKSYLGTSEGLLASRDKGETWQLQGSQVSVWQGPFFGKNENQMVVIAEKGVFATANAGQSWKRVADLKPNGKGFSFGPRWFGCYAWDPVNNFIYASAMGNGVYRLELP